MPRNVRNFWVEAEVDGRKTPIAFGPQGKDGGFRLTVYMRNQGEVERVVAMNGTRYDFEDFGNEDNEVGETLILWTYCKGAEGIRISRKR